MRRIGNNGNSILPTPNDDNAEIRGRFALTASLNSASSSAVNQNPLDPSRNIRSIDPTRSSSVLRNATNIPTQIEQSTPPRRTNNTVLPPLIRRNSRSDRRTGTPNLGSLRTVLFSGTEDHNRSPSNRLDRRLFTTERQSARQFITNLRSGYITSTAIAELLQLGRPSEQSTDNISMDGTSSQNLIAHTVEAEVASRLRGRSITTRPTFGAFTPQFPLPFNATTISFSQMLNNIRDSGIQFGATNSFLRALALVRQPNLPMHEHNAIEVFNVIQRFLSFTEPGDPNQIPPLVDELASLISASALQELISSKFSVEPAMDSNGNPLPKINIDQSEHDEASPFSGSVSPDAPLR